MHRIEKILLLFNTACLMVVSGGVLANTYLLPPEDQAMIGQEQVIVVGRDTTLSDEARRHNVGFNEIRLANPGVDPWLPQNDSRVLLPKRYLLPNAARRGVVLNVPEMRLYYFPESEGDNVPRVITHPVSIGRGDWETPLGNTKIIEKKLHPDWRPPESIRIEHAAEGDYLPKVVPAGPHNPLGQHALRLGLPGYLIHGTNKPYGIGMRVSHGCVRMYPEDIEEIFAQIEVGTPVNIVHQPYKFGWYLDTLYLEAHPPFAGEYADTPDIQGLLDAVGAINLQLGVRQQVDWQDALRIARHPTGLPVPVKIIPRQIISRQIMNQPNTAMPAQ